MILHYFLIWCTIIFMQFYTYAQNTNQNDIFQTPTVGYRRCMTASGEIGRCQPISSCILSDIQQNYLKVFEYICVIGKSYFGICCPENILLNGGPHFGDNIGSRARPNDDLMENRGCGMTTRPYPKLDEEREAEAGEWPWMAAILRRGFPNVFCGGTLITDRHVLTAAHCINQHKITELIVRLGEYDFRDQSETRFRDFRILEVIPHVDFDPITYENDIAIIRLDRQTIFTSYIWPICIPPSQENWEGKVGVAMGWGSQFFGGPYSKVLLEVSLPVWAHDDCQGSYVERIPETTFCAGSKEGGRDTCQGDSGGGLFYQLPNHRWIIIGIVSWGIRCGESNHPGVYTQVDKYIPWLTENTSA